MSCAAISHHQKPTGGTATPATNMLLLSYFVTLLQHSDCKPDGMAWESFDPFRNKKGNRVRVSYDYSWYGMQLPCFLQPHRWRVDLGHTASSHPTAARCCVQTWTTRLTCSCTHVSGTAGRPLCTCSGKPNTLKRVCLWVCCMPVAHA